MYAIAVPDFVIINFFWQHGRDVNAADHTGQIALHWSAVRGAVQVAEILLQEGASVGAPDIVICMDITP